MLYIHCIPRSSKCLCPRNTFGREAHHSTATSASLHEKMQNGSKTDSETNHNTSTSASLKGRCQILGCSVLPCFCEVSWKGFMSYTTCYKLTIYTIEGRKIFHPSNIKHNNIQQITQNVNSVSKQEAPATESSRRLDCHGFYEASQ